MTTPERSLAVELQTPHGTWVLVGYLFHVNNRNWFEFDDAYWETANRPVLGQIFEEGGRKWKTNTSVALPRWFSHLLPEGRLRQAVAEAADIHSTREFELISRLGASDLPGAVRVSNAALGIATASMPAASEEAPDYAANPVLKFSLAGAQLKFSVYGDGRGLTVPVGGKAGNFIAKFPDGRAGFEGVPSAELAAMELARASGVRVARADLVDPKTILGLEEWSESASEPALLVERFDRTHDDLRVHMEELAQVLNVPTLPEEAKYMHSNFETVAIFTSALAGVEAVGEVIDRLVLNVLVGNGDAHVKNWAYLYPDGRHPVLAPAYDIVPTVLYVPKDDLGMNLAGTKDFSAIRSGSFRRLGERSGFGAEEAMARAVSAAERIMVAWPVLQETLDHARYERLTQRLNELPLAAEA